MIKEATEQVLPTATGFAARQAIVAIRKGNIPLAPLLQRVGLSEQELEKRPLRISATAQAKLLEYAAEALNDTTFGLHVAQQSNPQQAGLLFYAASAGENMADALALYARYSRIVNEAIRVQLLPSEKGVVVEFSFVGLSRQFLRQNVEFGIAAIVKGLRLARGRNIHPTRVSFVHARSSQLREFERFFGCPVEFAAQSDQLEFSKETLALPLVTGDPDLLETLQPFCDEAAKERHTAKGTTRALVEQEVQKLLPHGKAQKENIARKLGLSERTLSRRLADERTNFDEVVDQLRRSLALQYIKERSLSLSQIAWLLGYEEATSFNHAFKRWTGHSPSVVRKAEQSSAAA